MGALPIFATPQACKKAAIGKLAGTKGEIETAMRERWKGSDFDVLLTTAPPYAEQGQKLPPPSTWENAFDAAAVAHCVWDAPAVAMLRKLAA
jgi:hypothetical protein